MALLDSINPSAIVITLYLLSQSVVAVRVLSYICGIFLTYLTVGTVSLLGLNALSIFFKAVLNSPTAYAVQGAIGAAMLIYSFFASSKVKPSRQLEHPKATSLAGLFLLGISITFLELPTAFPYFGAIALLISAELKPLQWLPVLLIYNLIFVLPPYFYS